MEARLFLIYDLGSSGGILTAKRLGNKVRGRGKLGVRGLKLGIGFENW